MRISLREKRQLTLPASLCHELGLEAGDLLDASIEGDKIIIRPRRKAAVDALAEVRRAIRESGVTLEELVDGGREVREELFKEKYPELADKYGS